MRHSEHIPFGGLLAPPGAAETARVSLLGVKDATQSSCEDRCASAPPLIRSAYDGSCFNPSAESGVDCAGRILDRGDLEPSGEGFPADAARYRDAVREELERGRTPFILGGDHAITPALVDAYRDRDLPGGGLHVVQWDAHPDMHPDFDGNPHSHACVAARLLERPHLASLTQVAIRTETAVQRRVRDAAAIPIATITAREAERRSGALLSGIPRGSALYLTVDLDGFDPAFAPGVAHPVPGGLSARAGLDLIHEIGERGLRLVGMDVVEACPRPGDDRTLVLAARLVHEAMALVLSAAEVRPPSAPA